MYSVHNTKLQSIKYIQCGTWLYYTCDVLYIIIYLIKCKFVTKNTLFCMDYDGCLKNNAPYENKICHVLKSRQGTRHKRPIGLGFGNKIK